MGDDRDLMRVEIETLWVSDERGRLVRSRELAGEPAPHLVVAGSDGQPMAAIGEQVPDAVGAELVAAVEAAPRPEPGDPLPEVVRRARSLLVAAVGRTTVACGPTYLVPPDTSYTSDATIARSSDDGHSALRDRKPKDGDWPDDEWQLLVDGALGPWAMALSAERVVAICHSARLGEHGAEAGARTDPAFRGRGLAASVTAAWAGELAPTGRHLFYSTDIGNRSSQRVAARLGLPVIGWRWQVYPTG